MKYFNIYKSMLLILSIAFVFFNIGCTTVPQETIMMRDIEGVNMTSIELRIRLNELGKFFAGTIEEAADEIIKEADDIEAKKNSLLWKTNVIPAALYSVIILDPVAAGIDFFALCYQMQQFFAVGYGRELFGKQQQIAINACNIIVKEAEIIRDEFRDRKYREENDRILTAWVVQNPIKNLNFNRRSTLELTAKTLGSEEYGIGSSVGSIAEGVNDIRRQITVYTEFLPKQIKWQAQYELLNLMGDSTIEKSLNNIDRVVNSVERITKVLEESPELFTDLQQSTLADLNKQLIIALSTLSNERAIVLEAMTVGRVAIMKEIYQQRVETLDRIDKLAQNTLNQSSIFASDVIDKIFWRVLIILVVVFVGGVVTIRLLKK